MTAPTQACVRGHFFGVRHTRFFKFWAPIRACVGSCVSVFCGVRGRPLIPQALGGGSVEKSSLNSESRCLGPGALSKPELSQHRSSLEIRSSLKQKEDSMVCRLQQETTDEGRGGGRGGKEGRGRAGRRAAAASPRARCSAESR